MLYDRALSDLEISYLDDGSVENASEDLVADFYVRRSSDYQNALQTYKKIADSLNNILNATLG